MKTSIKVHLKGSKGLDSFSTTINLSKDKAIEYYLNKTWNIGSGEFDYFAKCYKVEVLKTIVTHKITNQKMELVKDNGFVSTLFILDENENRIACTKQSPGGALNAKGEQSFEKAICSNNNLI